MQMQKLSLRRLLQVHEQVDKTFYRRFWGRGDHQTTWRDWADLDHARENKRLQNPEKDPFSKIFGTSDLGLINRNLRFYGDFMYMNWGCITQQCPQPRQPISTQQLFQALSKPNSSFKDRVTIDIHTPQEVEKLIQEAKPNQPSKFNFLVPYVVTGVKG